jgi:hypothetical protein
MIRPVAKPGTRGGAIFAGAFLATMVLLIAGIDRTADTLLPRFVEQRQAKQRLEGAAALVPPSTLVQKKSARDAKAAGLFWMANSEGAGAAVDLLNDLALLDQLFPGYGEALFEDKEFWRAYFRYDFGPDSHLGNEHVLMEQGFRVAYSWTGCFAIYQKYGADIVVLGSSETYKSLIPAALAADLAPIFSQKPRVLYCATHGMPLETVTTTARELLALSGAKPKAIVWGYSFWTSYLRSPTLAVYEQEIADEYGRYQDLKARPVANSTFLDRIAVLSHFKIADYLPATNWDRVMSFSLAKARAAEGRMEQGNHEGIHVSRRTLDSDDATLDHYLDANLKPYYDLVRGISDSDCSAVSEAPVGLAIDALRRLSPNVFIYVPPTTGHHRRTVPPCFIPAVTTMLRNVSASRDISFLDAGPDEFGLSNRDFISPTLDKDVFYFDINHANAVGSEKITRKLADWLLSRLGGAATR